MAARTGNVLQFGRKFARDRGTRDTGNYVLVGDYKFWGALRDIVDCQFLSNLKVEQLVKHKVLYSRSIAWSFRLLHLTNQK